MKKTVIFVLVLALCLHIAGCTVLTTSDGAILGLTVGLSQNTQNEQPKPKPTPDPEVKKLQQWIKSQGIDPGPIDGFLGKRTKAALKKLPEKLNPQNQGKDTQKK